MTKFTKIYYGENFLSLSFLVLTLICGNIFRKKEIIQRNWHFGTHMMTDFRSTFMDFRLSPRSNQ